MLKLLGLCLITSSVRAMFPGGAPGWLDPVPAQIRRGVKAPERETKSNVMSRLGPRIPVPVEKTKAGTNYYAAAKLTAAGRDRSNLTYAKREVVEVFHNGFWILGKYRRKRNSTGLHHVRLNGGERVDFGDDHIRYPAQVCGVDEALEGAEKLFRRHLAKASHPKRPEVNYHGRSQNGVDYTTMAHTDVMEFNVGTMVHYQGEKWKIVSEVGEQYMIRQVDPDDRDLCIGSSIIVSGSKLVECF